MRSHDRARAVSFTLVELLVALAIIVTLTLLGIPAIAPMMSANSVDSTANIIRGALMYARNAAIAQQTEGFCWLANGSVVESGVLEVTSDVSIIVDNKDTTGDHYFSKSGSWTVSAWADPEYPPSSSTRNYYHSISPGATPDSTAIWHFKIPAGLGSNPIELPVSIWWPPASAYAVQDAHITVQDGAGGVTYQVNQQVGGGGWYKLGGETKMFSFTSGQSYTVQLTNESSTVGVPGADNKYVYADAVMIGTEAAADAVQAFTAPGKQWVTNAWSNNYYVVILNRVTGTDNTKAIFAKIASNEASVVTAVAPWEDEGGASVALVSGSRFLIHEGDPATPGDEQTVGSGTAATASWDKLPEGAAVSPFDAKVPTRRVLPVAFTKKGRASFSNADGYVTVKVYSKEEPNNEDLWRFVRLYGNTGRTAVARKMSDLP